MSIMDTGFVSEAQEKFLMKNEPELYKAVVKKHGHFNKAKTRSDINLGSSNTIPNNLPTGRRRRK